MFNHVQMEIMLVEQNVLNVTPNVALALTVMVAHHVNLDS